MKNKKVILAALAIVAVVVGLGAVGHFISANLNSDKRLDDSASDLDKLNSIRTSAESGQAKKRALEEGTDVAVAYLDGEAIYKNEVLYEKEGHAESFTHNQIYGDKAMKMKTDEDLIRVIAKRKLMVILTKEVGIEYTWENAVESERASHELTKKRAAEGDENAIKLLQEDYEYYEGLGVTEEEYIVGLGASRVYYSQLGAKYALYYSHLSDVNFRAAEYEKHLDEKLREHDFKIVNADLSYDD